MNYEQTRKRMAVMAKHDPEQAKLGWRIEFFNEHSRTWYPASDPTWNPSWKFRGVRVERIEGKRVPLPWSMVMAGLTFRSVGMDATFLILATEPNNAEFLFIDTDEKFGKLYHADCTDLEYLDGETWKPLWTEEPGQERIVEIVGEGDV